MEHPSGPLNHCHVHTKSIIINRTHMLVHAAALSTLLYYRASFFFWEDDSRSNATTVAWLIIFAAELILSFQWLLNQAYRWRPVFRTAFPERLPEDEKLPAIDVFVCTADPDKEPTMDVMNTVVSAMALDYPSEKLQVYLSDDGGSPQTLHGMREAYDFARWWLPFCKRFGIKTRCPKAYFRQEEDDEGMGMSSDNEFSSEKQKVKEKYESFKERVKEYRKRHHSDSSHTGRDHPSTIEVVRGNLNDEVVEALQQHMPRLVYVSREKRPSHHHHFKAGALNVLTLWHGMDGLKGPVLSGSCFYIKRESLYRKPTREGSDLIDLKKLFGHSNEFVKNLWRNEKPSQNTLAGNSAALRKETQLLASCGYEKDTKWGQQVGFMYYSVAEDYFTGFVLHCRGWSSVYSNPSRPQFLGTTTTNLSDLLVQGTRWSSGLSQVAVSRFCPLIYGSLRMPVLQSMCYAELALSPFYCLPICCFATIPQICLVNGISIYPKVSSSYITLFAFVFLSSLCKHLYEVVTSGHSVHTFLNEQRIWMIKSTTCHVYGTIDGIMTQTGTRKASFLPTSKVDDDERSKRYEMGIHDFQMSIMFLAPMVTLVILNMASFTGGVARVLTLGGWDELFTQIVLSFFVLVTSYPVIEGMVLRTDKGRIPPSVTILSAILSLALLLLGSSILM